MARLSAPIATLGLSAGILILGQFFVYIYPTYDITTLAVGVLVPLFVGVVLLGFTKQPVLLLAYLAYFWSIIDDAPVYFDSVFTWPEVTRFNPALPHYTLEILLHAGTLAFMVLSFRQSAGRNGIVFKTTAASYALLVGAFVLAYAQNIPVNQIQTIVDSSWYLLDGVEHLGSVFLFALALWLASHHRRP